MGTCSVLGISSKHLESACLQKPSFNSTYTTCCTANHSLHEIWTTSSKTFKDIWSIFQDIQLELYRQGISTIQPNTNSSTNNSANYEHEE